MSLIIKTKGWCETEKLKLVADSQDCEIEETPTTEKPKSEKEDSSEKESTILGLQTSAFILVLTSLVCSVSAFTIVFLLMLGLIIVKIVQRA